MKHSRSNCSNFIYDLKYTYLKEIVGFTWHAGWIKKMYLKKNYSKPKKNQCFIIKTCKFVQPHLNMKIFVNKSSTLIWLA
jgi:hypothetical protein